jgi:ABC-type antimicrobial peptide transport system permease subunit
MERLVAESNAQKRFAVVLLSAFAVCALLLACLGIYGVVSYSVAQRTGEIGIRMALGARAQDVLGLVLKEGLRLVLVGVGAGLAAAFALTRLLASLLYGVSENDALTFALISLLLTTVALLAIYIPARRAARVDPMTALRAE